MVWATDNGSAYRDERVEEFLEAGKGGASALPAAFTAGQWGGGKRDPGIEGASGAGKRDILASFQEAAQKLALSQKILNTHRLEGQQGISNGGTTERVASFLGHESLTGGVL